MKYFKFQLFWTLMILSLNINAQDISWRPSGNKFETYQEILAWIDNPTEDYIMLVAHRGDWRNAPENSIRAIENCIKIGVEIVEIDIRMTKDSQLILMHDLTLDRTSTGKGKIADWPLDSIRTLYLRNGAGMPTQYKIPTLEETLWLIKDKPVLLNLDKAWDYLPETFKVLRKTGVIKQCIFKGNDAYETMRTKHGKLLDSIIYMPMVWPPDYNIYKKPEHRIADPVLYTKNYMDNLNPLAFEVIYNTDKSVIFEVIDLMRSKKVAVWVNTLWPELCAGHNDDLAIDAPDEHWGWVIGRHANIIQTDRPYELISYLKSKGLR